MARVPFVVFSLANAEGLHFSRIFCVEGYLTQLIACDRDCCPLTEGSMVLLESETTTKGAIDSVDVQLRRHEVCEGLLRLPLLFLLLADFGISHPSLLFSRFFLFLLSLLFLSVPCRACAPPRC